MRRFAEIDSTNRCVLDEARAGAPEGLVVVADHQTAGRGRLGRTWTAPAGSSLLMSVLLRPILPLARLHLVVAAMALAAGDACEAQSGVRPALKWPNDLIIDDPPAGERKLAGVLAEAELPAVVVGLGLNLLRSPGLPAGSVSLDRAAGREVDRDALLASVLQRLGRLLGDWDQLLSEYRRRCATVGRRVRVETTTETFYATAEGVTDEGYLTVRTGGALRTVSAADVVHLSTVAPASPGV